VYIQDQYFILLQTVIEVDGVNHQPVVVDSIQILAGQRYSFILQTNMPISNYWIRANPNIGPTGFVGGMNSAILRYLGAPALDPETTSTTTKPLLETNLHPLEDIHVPGVPTPGAADVNLNFNITFDKNLLEFFVNGVTFRQPSVPVLLQILSGAKTAQELLPSESIFALPPNQVIEISMQSTSPGSPVGLLVSIAAPYLTLFLSLAPYPPSWCKRIKQLPFLSLIIFCWLSTIFMSSDLPEAPFIIS
jgi:iron transport multicopper oxidase